MLCQLGGESKGVKALLEANLLYYSLKILEAIRWPASMASKMMITTMMCRCGCDGSYIGCWLRVVG